MFLGVLVDNEQQIVNGLITMWNQHIVINIGVVQSCDDVGLGTQSLTLMIKMHIVRMLQ